MRRSNIILLFAAMGICMIADGCHSSHKMTHDTHQNDMAPGNMTPFDDTNWQKGPSILPKSELLKQLESPNPEEKRRLWRLPVVIELAEEGLREVQSAYIGTAADLPPADRILLSLQDGALGVSLADRIHQYCPTGKKCRLIVAGYWGRDMAGLDGAKTMEPGSPYPFSLRAVIGPLPTETGDKENFVRYRDQ